MRPAAKTTRRRFLQQSAALTAAVAAPLIIPSGVLAAKGKLGANDRIGIAGIGIGRQGSGDLAGAARQKDTRVIAIADVNLPRAKQTAAAYKAEAYQDYRKVLDRKDVDAIITATPEHWRVLICIHCCQAGKDIYAEKPMSLTIREGRLIVQAVRKYERVFQTGSQQRSMEINRVGCELVRKGALGKITKVSVQNYPSPFECGLPAQPVPAGLDWDAWCGPTEVVPYHLDLYTPRAKPGWLSFRPYSGGEMTGWGSHGFDQVQWALGMDESGPIEVWTEGDKYAPPTYTQAESSKRGNDICGKPKVFFRYAGDIVMEMDKGPDFGAIFFGEKGTLTINRDYCKSDPPEIARDAIQSLRKGDRHIRNWLDCIKSRQKPNADVEIGHRSATVCHLGNIARYTGRKLRWDPVKEVFPDDSAANAYLDRERRKPYVVPESI
ncbi:MAG: Gfo/Idh/MocA family protein [Pirellulales bacterium]